MLIDLTLYYLYFIDEIGVDKDRCKFWGVILNELKLNDVIAVAAVGSPSQPNIPGDCPGLPFIVASSAVNHRLASFARGGTTDTDKLVYAPGLIENCLENEQCQGTSISIAQISGLIAYFLSLSEIDDLTGYDNPDTGVADDKQRWVQIQKLLIQLSYQRPVDGQGDGPPVPEIWNGIVESPCILGRLDVSRVYPTVFINSTIPTHHAPDNNGSSNCTNGCSATKPTLLTSNYFKNLSSCWCNVHLYNRFTTKLPYTISTVGCS